MSILIPKISFKVLSASIEIPYSKEDALSRVISLDIDLGEEEDIITLDNHSLRRASWKMQIHDTESFSEKIEALGGIGTLTYWKESDQIDSYLPEACFVSLAMARNSFQEIYELLKSGRVPNDIYISVIGIDYSSDSEGQTKEWDVTNSKYLPIKDVAIRFQMF